FVDSTENRYTGNQNGSSRTSALASGYAQNFDGNDWISINATESLNPSDDVTISGWFYLGTAWSSSSTTSQIIVEKYLDGDNNFHIALIGTDYLESGVAAGSLAFGFETDNGEYTKWTTRVSWAAGWYHFACVMDADTPANNKIYINGADNTDAGSAGSATAVNLAFDGEWGIGGRIGEDSEFPTGESFFTGRIDEIRIATTADRAASWFAVEYDTVNSYGAFVDSSASKETRTSPEHTIDKLIDISAPVGLWTASFYYNDTGASVSYATGLYERNFIVKHDTTLSLIDPSDAVSDKTAYAVAGEILYIEVELTDDANADKVTSATVKMNWSVLGVPTELTLNEIGNGRYGKSVNTSDLGTEGTYRININSYHQYYNNATDYFDVNLYHATELDFTDVDSTPVGNDFTATLIFTDTYMGAPITGAIITFSNGTAVSVVAEGAGQYNISLSTYGLGYGDHVYDFRATKAGAFVEQGEVTVTFTLRKHFTAVSVLGDFVTPYGEPTPVTIEIIDLDTGLPLSTTSSVNSWSFTSGYDPVSETTPSDFAVSLTTATWLVDPETVTLSVSMGGIYYSPSNHQFEIQIRNHYTSVAVIGDLISPYGTSTLLTLVITDTDTGLPLTFAEVSNFTFTPSTYGAQSDLSPSDLIFLLNTIGWSVTSAETVTLSVVMSGNYDNPADYDFDIQIRNHYTSVTVVGDLTTPFGESTLLTLVITDTDTGLPLTFAAVSNFTFTPSTYGAESDLNPSDLIFSLDTTSWSVAPTETVTLSVVMSGIYNNPTNYDFDITIRNHYTSLTVVGDLSTPYGFNTTLTIVITDLDTGATVSALNVSSFLLDPATGIYDNYPEALPSDLIVDFDTDSWVVATESVNLSVVMMGDYDNPSNYIFDIQIRNHHTTATVTGNLVTAYGEITALTIVITDSDTATTLSASDVSSFLLDPATGSYLNHPEDDPSDLIVDFNTSTWVVATESVTLSIVMTGNYNNPSNYTFNIQIRLRLTSITVIGNLETPYGNVTLLTIVITDIDSGTTISASNVSSFSFGSSYGPMGETNPSVLTYDLDTSTWLVAGESVTLSVVMLDNYKNPTDYVFTITIRSMTTSIINEPNDLRFPTGADLKIVVVVTVNEQGTSQGYTVAGMLQGEFAIRNSTQTIPIKEFYDLANGRYNLTIDASYFPEGIYTIYISINPANISYAPSQMTLVFEYTPARSELSSPDRSALTPYETDFVVTLTFLDIDRDQGIDGATITAQGITIYNQVDVGSGVYRVTVNVTDLVKGEHLYNLTADKVGYEAQTRSFKVTIRIAFAYAIPTVGALDIPVGDDPVFYVEYWDIDHDVPITDGFPFIATSSWIHSVTITYVPLQERYRVTFITNDDDTLVQNLVVSFNFSKGENYQFGLFNISITIRTHNTDFRLVSAVEPVSYTNNITIDVFYGDIDSGEGIASQYVSYRVWDGTVNVLSYLYNITEQPGYYTILVPAQQFGGLGLQNFTVYFNWTGPVSTYTNSSLSCAANIIGEDSRLTLLVTAEPTPYLNNMTYTLFYSAVNGTGISNKTGYVFVYIEFVGETVDLNQVTIWEVNQVTDPGKYSIQFNSSLLTKTGLIYMKVYIDWAKGIEPFYSNRTDTVSVRILPRDTLVSINAPIQTAYDVNATFSFTFDDVTGALNDPIANNAKLTITISLSDYSITYDGPTKTFTISFDTVQFGALGLQTFTLDVVWVGSPFYANQTGRSISVTVIARQTVLDYQAPSPTQYLDNVTFSVTWTDIIEGSTGIVNANITLYDGVVAISSSYYTVYEIGLGVYSVKLNTTYKASPGVYNIKVNITSTNFYYVSREDTRFLTIRYRATITSSEPIGAVPYSSSFTVILYYQDIITLDVIGNGSFLVTFDILNGSSWIYTIEWKQSQGYYELIVETSNQPSLAVGSVNSLHINMSFAISSPFYKFDDAYITFEIRSRASSLERQLAPIPTPYLDNVTFTVYFSDADDLSPITSATINVLKGITPLILNSEYFYSNLGGGVFEIIVQTSSLDGLGATSITVQAAWIGGSPFHDDAEVDLDLTVIERTTNVEITIPPSQTYYQENVTFVVSFLDIGTGLYVPATKDMVQIDNGAVPLTPAQFSMTQVGAGFSYEISFDSTILGVELVTNRILTVYIDWPASPNYHKDDSTSTSVTTIARNTYVSIDRPGNTPYGENATFTFAFVDSTTLPEVLVQSSGDMSIVTNLTESPSLTYNVGTRLFTMVFNTSQFGDVGLAGFYINVTWAGSPFYANKTLQLVYVTVTMRQTQVNFDAPAPTPYGDVVTFDVSYTDISGFTEVGIPDATLIIYDGDGVSIPGANYILTPDGSGNFEIQFDTNFFSEPGYYVLNVSLTYTGGYFRNDASAIRTLNVRFRTTILSANPVGQIGYETTLEITLLFQDILTLSNIDNTSFLASFDILNDTGTPWVYSISWQPATSDYLLSITTVGQTTLVLGDHALWLNMSYAYVDPFYRWDDVYVEFSIRTRTSALDLQEAAIPAPYQENISFVVYYWDADVTQGISGATFILEESGVGVLTLNVNYFVDSVVSGVYTIYIDSAVLGGLSTYSINVTAVWSGLPPYHNNAQRDVSVTTIRRTATVDILEPANQPRFLDNMTFTFAYLDSINGLQIPGIAPTDVSIFADGTLLTEGQYVLTPNGNTFIVTINSTVLSDVL
ncbi:MAG: LamG domain-containing protein, partial [Candidatus Thorarchaeota archaeon]